MKKSAICPIILCLSILAALLISCSTSTPNTTPTQTTTTEAPTTASMPITTAAIETSTTSAATTDFANSDIPIYPGSVEDPALEYGKANIGVYLTDVANKTNVMDYYNSELPKVGWKVSYQDSDQLVAIKSPNEVTISVTTLLTDETKCAINIDIEPHG
jgi:hypothetical protein